MSTKRCFFDFGLEKFENGQKHDFWPKMAKKWKIFKNFRFFFSKSIQNRSKRILNQKCRKKNFLINVEVCSSWDICQNIASNTRLAPKPEHSIRYPSSSEPNARLCRAPALTCYYSRQMRHYIPKMT